MKKWVFLGLLSLSMTASGGETNATADQNSTSELNTTTTVDKNQLNKHLKEQMKREENFARTQEFKKGKDYNLSEHMIDPKDLENIHVDEPLYDFDMDDVYD